MGSAKTSPSYEAYAPLTPQPRDAGGENPSGDRLWQRHKQLQTSTGKAETAPNSLYAAAKAGEALGSTAAPCSAHLPVPALPRAAAAGEHPAVRSSPLFVKDNLLELLDQDFGVFFQSILSDTELAELSLGC